MPKIGLLIMLVLLISACGELKPPKRGAVESQARIGSRGYFTLHSSLNCAYPGEEVVFTLAIENDNPSDITMIGTPVIEIVLDDGHTALRWSDDPTYPVIDPILKRGERRTYEWHWTAQKLDGSSVAQVIAEGAPPQGNALDLHLFLGINRIAWHIPEGATKQITCAELRSSIHSPSISLVYAE